MVGCESDVSSIAESFDGFGQVACPHVGVADECPAQGQQVVQGVGRVFGQHGCAPDLVPVRLVRRRPAVASPLRQSARSGRELARRQTRLTGHNQLFLPRRRHQHRLRRVVRRLGARGAGDRQAGRGGLAARGAVRVGMARFSVASGSECRQRGPVHCSRGVAAIVGSVASPFSSASRPAAPSRRR